MSQEPMHARAMDRGASRWTSDDHPASAPTSADARRIAKVLEHATATVFSISHLPERTEAWAKRRAARQPGRNLAKRFAAKEACAKALRRATSLAGCSGVIWGCPICAVGAADMKLTAAPFGRG